MARRRSRSDAALAAEVWRRLLDFFMTSRDHHARVLADMDLSPGDMKALFALEPDQPQPMRALAAAWQCDASNVTWVVDRLEQRGLVERRASEGDRRVKMIALTRQGEETKAKLRERLYEPPTPILELSRDDLEVLADALARLPSSPPHCT